MIDGVDKDKCEKELNKFKRENGKLITENKQKLAEFSKRLKLIITCENARLNRDQWLEANIEPEDREMASKLLKDLNLDNLQSRILNFHEDEDMADAQQISRGPDIRFKTPLETIYEQVKYSQNRPHLQAKPTREGVLGACGVVGQSAIPRRRMENLFQAGLAQGGKKGVL